MLRTGSFLCALALGCAAAAPLQGATIYRSFSEAFSISNSVTLGTATTLHPDFRTGQQYPHIPVEGFFEGLNLAQLASTRLVLPGSDPALGTLKSATVSLASRQSVTSGTLFDSLTQTGHMEGWTTTASGEGTVTLAGTEIAFGAVTASSGCTLFPNLSYTPCIDSRKAETALNASVVLDPSLLPSGDLAFTLDLAQITRWDGYVLYFPTPDPGAIANQLNIFSWSGTLDVTYAYEEAGVAVPEPGTWAMLVLGFVLVGGVLRRRPARARATLAPR